MTLAPGQRQDRTTAARFVNRRAVAFVGVLLLVGAACTATLSSRVWAQPATPSPAPAGSPNADTGYSIGFDMGRDVRANLARDGVGADADSVIRGFTDGMRGGASAIPESRMGKLLADLQRTVNERRTDDRMKDDPVFRATAEEAAKRSAQFMKGFTAMQGVTVLPGGIAYQVVRAGDGPSADGATAVTVNYEAFTTGNEQVANGRAVEIGVEQMMPGAQEIIRKMKVGDRWYAAIPAEAAFGRAGRPPKIGPNEALVVDVELLGVKK